MIVWFVFVLGALSATGKVVVTQVGHRVILDCGVGSFSRSVAWHHQGVKIIGYRKKGMLFKADKRMVLRQETKLEIIGVKVGDAGKYKCEADQHTSEHTLLLVSALVPSGVLQLGSEAVLLCQVTGADLGVEVRWKRPTELQPSGSQEVRLKPVAASDAGTWQCVFDTGGEVFSLNVTIWVEELKPLPPSRVTTLTPDSPEDSDHGSRDVDQPLGLDWWAWLTLGAGCLVLTLLLVSVILLCQRVRRRRRMRRRKKFLRMKNAPHPLRLQTYCQCNRPTAAAKPQQGRRREKPSALPL